MHIVSNKDIARALGGIAEHLEMQEVSFKSRAYEKAAEIIEGMTESVASLYAQGGLGALEAISGVGASLAEKIEEFLTKGKIEYYEALKKKIPVDLDSFAGIEGLGPKSILKLYKALNIKNFEDLERALRVGKVREVTGFGEKTEKNILAGIAFMKRSAGRLIVSDAVPCARELEEALRAVKGVEQITIAGSLRRRKETVGDIDVLAVTHDPVRLMTFFTSMPGVERVHARGKTKSSVRLSLGIDADIRIVPPESYGAALNYFTGSKNHNIALRRIAVKKGLTLNEYGLYKGNARVAGETEEGIYEALGIEYVEPELREDKGEIEAATRHVQGKMPGLPKLIGYDDLQGDLQMHSTWTDGKYSIEDMARGAAARGMKYIAITDHTKRLAMTHGLDEKRIKDQWKEIDSINKKMKGVITVLKGTECDILKDGSLDFSDDILSKLDIVGVSVHSYFNLTRKEQTERIERAMRNPHVDILFHPTGRIIGKRDGYDVDMGKIIDIAKETGTALEVDSFDRLDLKDEYVRECVKKEVRFSIDSDAHAPVHFEYLEYGIAQARRGWATKKDVLNAWPLEKMLGFLKK
ncbi:MAG: DNA polymerase/3'-5' exonuclease PolX [Patescibacteria group bacterium]|nr:DNA polymerase/3'-5' exonuclease PolX [Patescibacteria group bacterium]